MSKLDVECAISNETYKMFTNVHRKHVVVMDNVEVLKCGKLKSIPLGARTP